MAYHDVSIVFPSTSSVKLVTISEVIIGVNFIKPNNRMPPIILKKKHTNMIIKALFIPINLYYQPTVKYIKLLVNNSECVNTINTKAKLNEIAPNKLMTPSFAPTICVLSASIKTVTIANKKPDIIDFKA